MQTQLDDSAETRIIASPWSETQVLSLSEYQLVGLLHPYTCLCGEILGVTREGFVCECGYKQNWALKFAVDGSWRKYLDQLKFENLFEEPHE